MKGARPLTQVEHELLKLLNQSPEIGEPTTALDEQRTACSASCQHIEATLGELASRGLLSLERAINLSRPCHSGEQDIRWWCLTKAGRAAIGLLPRGDETA